MFDYFNQLEESKGKVKNAKILTKTVKDITGKEVKRGTGAGFVSFETQISATTVCNKKASDFSSLEIVFKSAFTKQKMKEKLKKIEKSKIRLRRNLNQSLGSFS